jgi:DNA-binding MarR family transcriptional regulator
MAHKQAARATEEPPLAQKRPLAKRAATSSSHKVATGLDAKRRVSRRRREIQEIEKTEPLQRRILRALAASPQTPSELARQLEASKEGISRLLTQLHDDALVERGRVEGDARRKLYRLTPEGETAFGRHLAFGKREPRPRPPTHEQTIALLRAALENAVRLRRQANRLDDAAARMRLVLEQARELADNALLVDTLAELAITLRQARRSGELATLLAELEQIVEGWHAMREPELVLPAAAHLEYELGRIREGGVVDVAARARHLEVAQALYERLVTAAEEPDRKAFWVQREGWSVLSLASNLRERSCFERAVEKASEAMRGFQSIGDVYGQSRSLFMIGLCLRLMGDFEQAWRHLADAFWLAQEHTFERFQADTLLQMGDVQRCMGRIEPARELLTEAHTHAVRLQLGLIQAFALSSLGACAYQQGEYDAAHTELHNAHELFEACAHQEGLALNLRRQVVVESSRQARSGKFKALERLVGSAHRHYEDLDSPAGAAACDIELGRLNLVYGGSVDSPIANLIDRLADPLQRDLIELDPWVPSYLLEFAQLANHSALRSSAETIVADGRRRRCAWYTQIVGSAGSKKDQLPHVDKGVLEMGGECRRATFIPLHATPLLAEISKSTVAPTWMSAADSDPATHAPLFVLAEQSIPSTVG